MSHVEGHPRDRLREFIEYMVQDAPMGGVVPSSIQGVNVKDAAGRSIPRGGLPLTLGAGALGLLMSTQFQGTPEERERRRKQLLEEIEGLREGDQGWTEGTKPQKKFKRERMSK